MCIHISSLQRIAGSTTQEFETDEYAQSIFKAAVAASSQGILASQVNILNFTATNNTTSVAVNSVRMAQFARRRPSLKAGHKWISQESGYDVRYSITVIPSDYGDGTISPENISKAVTAEIASEMTTGRFDNTLVVLSNAAGSIFDDDISSTLLTSAEDVEAITRTIAVTFEPTGAPTLAPTSAVGTPTLAPTTSTSELAPVAFVLPAINTASLVTTETQADVSFTLSSSDSTASGNIYCVLYTRASLGYPDSVDDLITNGRVFSFATSNDVISFSYTGLSPATSYMIYWAVVTSYGVETAYVDVLLNPVAFSTDCCKSFGYVDTPSTVYGDVNEYVDTTANVFYFALSSLPSFDLTATASVTYTNGSVVSANLVTLLPADTFVYTSATSSALLTRNFIISAPDTFEADVILRVRLTGTSANEYETSEVEASVSIISTFNPLPAPQISSAQFADNGLTMLIIFGFDTDYAGLTGTWACSEVFTFTGADACTCTWTTASKVTARFATDDTASLIVPGDNVTLLTG